MPLLFLLSSAGDPAKAGYQATSVTINEFVASNQRSLVDGDGNTPDWIELYNGTAASVPLAGWSLTDDGRNLRKWSFPAGATLRAGAYLVVFASGQPTDHYVDKKGYFHTNFALDKDGEYLALVDPQGTIDINGKPYAIGRRLVGRYITATIFTHRRMLLVNLGARRHKRFPFPISEPLVAPIGPLLRGRI